MSWLVRILAAVGTWCVVSVVVTPFIGRWLAKQAGDDEFGWDLDAPPPDPRFQTNLETRIFDWARAENDLADRSNP